MGCLQRHDGAVSRGVKKGPSGGEKPIGILPGQYYDQETGLHYNYFRDYDPTTGRYIQADRIGLEGGINLFAYVENSPANWIDPFGLSRYSDMLDQAKACKLSDSDQRKLIQDFLNNLLPIGFTKGHRNYKFTELG